MCSDDDTERYRLSRIKTLKYASCTEIVRTVKIIRRRRLEALAQPLLTSWLELLATSKLLLVVVCSYKINVPVV